jgi:hypothetical protein
MVTFCAGSKQVINRKSIVYTNREIVFIGMNVIFGGYKNSTLNQLIVFKQLSPVFFYKCFETELYQWSK